MKTRVPNTNMEAALANLLVAIVIGSSLVGCSGRPATAQVRGRVTFKDGSTPQGEVCLVRFEPTADSTAAIKKAATGEIARDGSFVMFTRKPGDGVFLGNYAVTFSIRTKEFDSGSLVAEKYMKASTTPHTVNVDRDLSDLVYEIEPAEPATSEAAESPNDAAAKPPSEDAVEPNSDGAQ